MWRTLTALERERQREQFWLSRSNAHRAPGPDFRRTDHFPRAVNAAARFLVRVERHAAEDKRGYTNRVTSKNFELAALWNDTTLQLIRNTSRIDNP